MTKLAALRRKAFQAQNCRCFYCQLPMWDGDGEAEFAARYHLTTALARLLRATAEHLQARQDGGKNQAGNIAAACLFCNRMRHHGRQYSAPAPAQYRERVQARITVGKWHPAIQHLQRSDQVRSWS
ncbi:HNH endonuclease [Acidovorax sp.]|uniref:HNH endonuclease n=1 Tax=Acidovorax sp. TaxID=1872122 RepID=UPI0025BAB8FD|nr:HNH endonuclease [Acidovorax sp.]MBW8464167.1 HNH endonuclease [Acidovorax sp.]